MATAQQLDEAKTTARNLRLRGLSYPAVTLRLVPLVGDEAASVVAQVRAELEECAALSTAEHRHRMDALWASSLDQNPKVALDAAKVRMRLDGVLTETGALAKPEATPVDPAEALRQRLRLVR